MQTLDQYMLRYFELCATCKTYKEAYEKVEAEYKKVNGVGRIASYINFRNVKSRWVKDRRKNVNKEN